jgi:CHASE2 domain-containing sensor protein
MTDEKPDKKPKTFANKAIKAYFDVWSAVGIVVGYVAGLVVAVMAAGVLLYVSAWVMFAMGWYFLLAPVGIIAALMLVLIWLKRQGAFDEKKDLK